MMKLKPGRKAGSQNMDDYSIVYDLGPRNVMALCLLAREHEGDDRIFNDTSDPKNLLDFPVGSWVDSAAEIAGSLLDGSPEGNESEAAQDS